MSSLIPDDDRTMIRPGGSSSLQAHSSAGASGNALPVGTYLSEFELTGVLGEGGFGIVYLAWDHSLERQVALKEYMPAALASREGSTQVQVKSQRHRETFDAGMKSFVNEAKLLASFDHPSLVKVYRFWEAHGTAYMVMPYYEGITLKDKLRELGEPPDEAWLMALLAPLTEVLAVIHAQNCFHRDIAPDNVILLNATGKPLLLDFGAARRVIGDMTQALTVILKPGYAPVEQYAESPDMKQGGWTDIYALAGTVHFAIMGKTPPPAVSRLLNDKHVLLELAAQGRYSAGFLQAIDRALRVRPEQRTQTVDALRAELGLADASRRLFVERTVLRPVQVEPTPAPGARRGVWTGVGLLALVATAAATYFVLVPGSPTVATQATAIATAAPAVPFPVIAAPAPTPAVPIAPPVPPIVPVAPTAPTPFAINEEFAKVMAARTPGFDVDARAMQPQLRIGKDALSFTVASRRDGFVQVLVLGPDGSALLLFPNATASDNRIKAGQTLTLPQASWKLDTAEPVGTEQFLIIVSAQPRDFSELGKAREYIFLKLPTQSQGQTLAATLTRSTPMLLGGLKSCPSADCDAYGAARFSVDITR